MKELFLAPTIFVIFILFGAILKFRIPEFNLFLLSIYFYTLITYLALFIYYVIKRNNKMLSVIQIIYLWFCLGTYYILEIVYFNFKLTPDLNLFLYLFQNFRLLSLDFRSSIHSTPAEVHACFIISIFICFFIPRKNSEISILYLPSIQKRLKYILVGTIIIYTFSLACFLTFFPPNQFSESDDTPYGHQTSSSHFHLAPNLNIVYFILEGVSWRSFQDIDKAFLNHWTECRYFFIPVPHSSNSIFSLLTGRYSDPTAEPNFKISSSSDTIPHLYQNNGYSVRFFYSGSGYFENLNRMLSHFEIPLYDKEFIQKNTDTNYQTFPWGIDDKAMIESGKKNIAQEGIPFVHFYYFTNTHSPYFNPAPDQFRRNDNSRDYGRFLNVVEYDLSLIHDMRKYLEAKSPDRTVYILLSDHGESFGENGFYKHGFSILNQEIRVPLYFSFPGKLKIDKIHAGSLLDLMTSIASVQGIQDRVSREGKSLFDKNYKLDLKLSSWGTKSFRGRIEKDRKYILDFHTDNFWESNLDETMITTSINSAMKRKILSN